MLSSRRTRQSSTGSDHLPRSKVGVHDCRELLRNFALREAPVASRNATHAKAGANGLNQAKSVLDPIPASKREALSRAYEHPEFADSAIAKANREPNQRGHNSKVSAGEEKPQEQRSFSRNAAIFNEPPRSKLRVSKDARPQDDPRRSDTPLLANAKYIMSGDKDVHTGALSDIKRGQY
jgi:hypothetical protein